MGGDSEKYITIPDGMVFDYVDGDKIVLRGNPVSQLPTSWDECLHIVDDVERIDSDCSEIEKFSIIADEFDSRIHGGDSDKCLLPAGMGGAMLALCQLLVCRNAWWKRLGWKPDWSGVSCNYCICNDGGVCIFPFATENKILAFPSIDVALSFREAFRDLIEEAKELL